MVIRFIVLLVVIACLLTVGLFATFWPRVIQRYALAYYESNPLQAKVNPFRFFMRTDAYMFSLRAAGVLALFMGLSIAALIVWGWLHGVNPIIQGPDEKITRPRSSLIAPPYE